MNSTNSRSSMVVFVGCFFALVLVVVLMNGSRNTERKIDPRVQPSVQQNQYIFPQQYPLNRIPPSDVLLDPYAPPIRYPDQIPTLISAPLTAPLISASLTAPLISAPLMPIATNIGAVNASYRQVGLITPASGSNKGEILALLGRPLFTNRRKWQYYAISNQHNNIKLPIRVKGRSASNEYGVDELFDGDVVFVEGKKETFRVTLYEKEQIEYVPY